MNEEWRAVVGWEGLYEVSNLGRVRSLPRETPCMRNGREMLHRSGGKVMKLSLNGGLGQNQVQVVFQKTVNDESVHANLEVGRVVWRAFVGVIPPHHQVRKIGPKYDCSVTNLCLKEMEPDYGLV